MMISLKTKILYSIDSELKENWNKKDLKEFYEFEQSLKGDIKSCEWEQRIVNTKLLCYGKTSSKAREVADKIKKGNYIEFLENIEIKTHFDSLVCAFLICKIKDFDLFEKMLDKYVLTIDNWASCDTLKFKKRDKEKLTYMITYILGPTNKITANLTGVV